MRNNERNFTIQKIINCNSKVLKKIDILPFVILFCLFWTMINQDAIIVPSEGSVLSTEENIPTLELNVTTHGSLTIQDMEKGEIMFFYYIEITQPYLYELTLTMPPEVYEVRAEFWKVTKNENGEPRVNRIENLYYDFGYGNSISSQHIFLSEDDFNKNIGLTLILKSNRYPYSDKSFSVKFTQVSIAPTDQFQTTLTDEVRNVNQYFILDQSKLQAPEAGFYYLSTILTIAANTGIESFNGWMGIHCISPEKEFYLSNGWDNTGIFEQTETIYLDPDIDYYFVLDASWWSSDGGNWNMLTLQFSVDPVIPKLLSSNETTSIESGVNFIKVAIPSINSVKLTFSQDSVSNLELRIISRLNTRNYGTFYSNWFEDRLQEDSSYYDRYSRKISYIQLVRREIKTSLANLYDWPNDASHIWFGGLIETIEREYSNNEYFDYNRRLTTWTDGGLLFDNEGYIFLRIDSSDSFTLYSEIVSLNDNSAASNDLLDYTSIDLTEEDPLKIYEFSGLSNNLYSFHYESLLDINEPSIFEDEDIDYYGQYQSIKLDTSVFLPGIVTPIFSSEKNFQLVTILNGYSIIVYGPSYIINYWGRLTTPRDQVINVDEFRSSIAEALITTTIIKDDIPTTGNLIDITINNSQEIFWFSLVVEENEIYSVLLEAHPFFQDNIEVNIVDTRGNNPFYGNNIIKSYGGSMSGKPTILIGRRTSKCYVSLKGYGLVRLNIEKLGSINTNNAFGFPLTTSAVFGIILILGIITF
ncbi:MAG: hypothetical protein ACW964_03790, partial [Candidatus Hodarchaeales archaeon]